MQMLFTKQFHKAFPIFRLPGQSGISPPYSSILRMLWFTYKQSSCKFKLVMCVNEYYFDGEEQLTWTGNDVNYRQVLS